MPAKRRARCRRTYLVEQAHSHAPRLADTRNGGDQALALDHLPDAHRNPVVGNFSEGRKPTLIDLLLAAPLAELHADIGVMGPQVGGRVVEGQVSVLTDADETDVQPLSGHQPVQTGQLRGNIRGGTFNRMESPKCGNLAEEIPLEEATGSGRMFARQSDEIIKLECGDLAPVNILPDQKAQHIDLAQPCRDRDGRAPLSRNSLVDFPCPGLGRGLRHTNLVVTQNHPHGTLLTEKILGSFPRVNSPRTEMNAPARVRIRIFPRKKTSFPPLQTLCFLFSYLHNT